MLISNKWDQSYLSKHEPERLPVFPYVMETKKKFATVIQVKNGRYNWYGRPPSKGSYLNQYREYQDLYYLCRLTAKDFTGKLLIEVEDTGTNSNRVVNNKRDQKDGFKNTMDRFERNFTNRSDDPSTVLLFTRPPQSRPMQVEQLLPNTKERYYEKMDAINSSHIIQSHSWSPRLLGGSSNSLFTSNVYIDELKVKDATTNLSIQTKVRDCMETALSIFKQIEERKDLKEVTFKFMSPYLKMIENERIANDRAGNAELAGGIEHCQ